VPCVVDRGDDESLTIGSYTFVSNWRARTPSRGSSSFLNFDSNFVPSSRISLIEACSQADDLKCGRARLWWVLRLSEVAARLTSDCIHRRGPLNMGRERLDQGSR
jgi:hypothetical protein